MKKRIACLLCAVVLALGGLVACGGNNTDNNKNTENVSTESEGTNAGTEAETEAAWDAAVALEALKDANPAEDNYLVLSGIVGGWAPVVMVLDNDGNFFCVVDYAGQATVKYAEGTYTENADGSITAEGTQYNTGEELIYEIACTEGTYSVNMPVPDTGSEGEITGTK